MYLEQSIHDEKPIYDRRHSQLTPTGNWDVTENTITEYYTGCPPGHMGPLPYAYDCRRFLNCWHGKAHLQTCSVGTVFNPETLECDRPDKVKCDAAFGMLEAQSKQKKRMGKMIDAAVEGVDILCPLGALGLQPYPNDCTKFINCANGNIHIQNCGPGTAFSKSMQVCVHPDKADCKGGPSHLMTTPHGMCIVFLNIFSTLSSDYFPVFALHETLRIIMLTYIKILLTRLILCALTVLAACMRILSITRNL